MPWHTCGFQKATWRSLLSLPTTPGPGTRVVRLESHLLYPPSHLTSLGPTSEGVLGLLNEFTADCLGINHFPGVAGYREPKLEKLTGCVGVSILKQDQALEGDTEQGWDSEVRGNTGQSTVF